MTLTMYDRVSNGIRLLMRYHIENETGLQWWEPLEADTLALADTTSCVIGQTFGHFDVGTLKKLKGYPHRADGTPMEASSVTGMAFCDHHGFSLLDGSGSKWDELTEEWVAMIQKEIPKFKVGDLFRATNTGMIRELIGVVKSNDRWYGIMEIPGQNPQSKSFAELAGDSWTKEQSHG